jgi:hypothetical protein
MPVPDQVKKDYNTSAITYNDYATLPSGQLESQLIRIALGDCTSLKYLKHFPVRFIDFSFHIKKTPSNFVKNP